MTNDSMKQIFGFISEFTEVTKEDMNAISGLIHFSSHTKNEMLQKQGHVSKRIAFILKGSVRAFYIDEQGNDHTVNFMFENHPLVAFESFTQQTPVPFSAIALEPTDLIWTSYEEFFEFLSTHPKYETALRNILSKYMSLGGEHMKLLRIHSAKERYEALCNARPEVIKRVPLKYIASYLQMAVETLSRIRAGKG